MKKVYLDSKNKKGITLIALVITIIVLLILAGVAVSSITGNDDIMDKAQNAKVATDNANEEEEIKMAAVTAMADNMEGLGVLTAEKLSTALNNKYPVADEGDKIKVFAKSTYTLDKNGSVTNDGETPKGEFSITSFSYTPNTVSIGGTSVEPVVNISGTPYKGPKYTSSDESKATVDETTGVVTGVASGEVTITVTYKNYQNIEVTETTTVTVKPAFEPKNFTYTGNIQTCELPAGTYKLEAWGAQGGNSGGKGAKAQGTFTFSTNMTLYICVGGDGTNHSGYNGGGAGDSTYKTYGGGCTSIATISGKVSEIGSSNLNKILIIAGGGGASGKIDVTGTYVKSEGTGGNAGQTGSNGSQGYASGYGGTIIANGGNGASTTQGGAAGTSSKSGSISGSGSSNGTMRTSGAGGGGLYGGGSGAEARMYNGSQGCTCSGNAGSFGIGGESKSEGGNSYSTPYLYTVGGGGGRK